MRRHAFIEHLVNFRHRAGARPRLPFLTVIPGMVVVVGIAVACLIALLGVQELREQSDKAATLRSRVLAESLASRLRATALEDRSAVVERAAQRSGAELLLVEQNGRVVVDGSLATPERSALIDYLVRGEGEAQTRLGRTRFYAAPLGKPLEHLSLLMFVGAPERPFATGSLLTSITALTVLLVGAAGLVAFTFGRDVQADILYVRRRIVEMAREDGNPSGKPIPVRGADQVGVLTSAFNVLVERFAAAELAYRQDLKGALQYDRERTAFLAALSHELRTPLNAILGFTDVLLSEVDGPLSEGARENLEVLRGSAEHLRSLINDILDLSALESGELQLDCKRVDVHGVAAEVVREAQVMAQSKPVSVTLSGQPAVAWADPRRVRQIIGNVVGNAVKFTDRGEVRIRTEARASHVVVAVSDTGPGIAPEEQAAIFEEYRQAGKSQQRELGTGLGLAITRRLLSMHGGRIELQSVLNVGSEFVIFLPVEPPRHEAAPLGGGTPANAPTAVEAVE